MGAPGQTFEFALDQTTARVRKLTSQIRTSLTRDDAAAVHDLRVSIRRLVQALFIFAPCFSAHKPKKAQRRLKRIMAIAGLVRNCDVAADLCGRRAALFRKEIQSHRDDGSRKLIIALQRWIQRNHAAELIESLASSGARDREFGRNGVENTARRALRRMTREFFHKGNQAVQATSTPREFHDFRIVAKKIRYTLELLLPIYGRRATIRLNQIKIIQSKLGDVNDCETVRAMLAKWGGNRKTDCLLRERETRDIEAFRKLWDNAFAGVHNLHGWLQDFQRFRITAR